MSTDSGPLQFNIYNNTANTIYARHNFWGTDNISQIQQRIYDKNDNAAKGVVLFQPISCLLHEAEVVQLLAPDTLVDSGTVVVPTAMIRNNGLTSESIPVSFRISSVYQADTSVFVNAGASAQVDFRPWMAEPVGSHDIKCLTSLPTDEYQRNDTLTSIVAVIPDTLGPVILSCTPDFGGNIGSRLMTIEGLRFLSGARIKLSREGEPDILADTIWTMVATPDSIIVGVNLTDAAVGMWDLTVINPDGKAYTYHDGFRVEVGRQNLVVDITGRDILRWGRSGQYSVSVGNYGNVDALHVLVTFGGIPSDATVGKYFDFMPPPSLGPDTIDWLSQPFYYERSGEIVIPMILPLLRPNQEMTFTFSITAPGSGAILSHELKASISSPGLHAGDHPFATPFQPNGFDCFVEIAYTGYTALSGITPGGACVKDVLGEELFVELLHNAYGVVRDPTAETAVISGLSTDAGLILDVGRCVGAFTPGVSQAIGAVQTVLAGCDALGACTGFSCIGFVQNIFRVIFGGSWDPNDKAGPAGYDTTRHFVNIDQSLRYVVYFENDSTALFPAEEVVVVDTLDSDLDWSTLTFGQIFPGSGDSATIRPNFSYTTDFDQSTGVITWTLNDINLPPDTMPYWGEGWVSYSVKPKANLLSGTRIENIAAIKFDDNPWILAPMDSIPIFNTIDAGPPSSSVFGLSDTAKTDAFPVCWGGQDDSAGSGVRSFDVYVSVDYAPFVLWITDTTAACSVYTGTWGSSYRFYSVARDNVGHVEPVPITPDASTFVTSCNCAKFGDLNLDGSINAVDVVIIVNYVYKTIDTRQQIPSCPGKNGDWDCNDLVNAVDVVRCVNYVYKASGLGPCNPCIH